MIYRTFASGEAQRWGSECLEGRSRGIKEEEAGKGGGSVTWIFDLENRENREVQNSTCYKNSASRASVVHSPCRGCTHAKRARRLSPRVRGLVCIRHHVRCKHHTCGEATKPAL
eukprot:1989483-Rhodomonas_salina.1